MYSFLKKIILSTALLVVVGIFPFLTWGIDYFAEISFSFSISIINAIAGFYLAYLSIEKTDSEFYSYVYGGMLIRMIVVFGFSIFMIKREFVSTTPYMLFLILFYTLHQWVEISSWLKELPGKKVNLKI
tara:strand:+ start:264 stop:650 length:387 start_codon:yes stop_codon:yes gene_type:complete